MTYCSLGEFCHASALLKSNGLKHASFPFDWIFSSAEMVKHCIEDDFKTFLSKSEYTTNALEPDLAEHAFYATMVENHEDVETKEKVIFNHHNPLVNEEHYSYFERCVNRFRELLNSSEDKTFVMFQRNIPDVSTSVFNSLMLSKFLNEYTSNFKLLVLHHNVTGNQSHQLIKGENLKFLTFTTISESIGTEFANKKDDEFLNKLFNEIR